MAAGCELTILLPAYREADALHQLLPALAAAAGRLTSDHEIVVVDARVPADDTQKVCAEHGARHVFRASVKRFRSGGSRVQIRDGRDAARAQPESCGLAS